MGLNSNAEVEEIAEVLEVKNIENGTLEENYYLNKYLSTYYKKINYEKYRPNVNYSGDFASDGYVQPYGDSPLDDENVGEFVYLNIINI